MSDGQERAEARAARRVVIVGFMGAGKTSVARELGRRLGVASVDLDDQITRRAGRTPQQLIDEDGEPRFREIETRALEEVLTKGGARIIAAGGGTWTIAANREHITRHNCLSVWLDAPFDLCWHRITRSRARDRPLARSSERTRALYDARRGVYALADRRIVVAAEKSVERIAAEIEKLLRPIQDVRQWDEQDAQGGTKDNG